MLIERVLEKSKIYLMDHKVKDIVVGISLIGIELSNGSVGVSYMLRENLSAGCSIFTYGQEVIGKNAFEIANWALNGNDVLQKSIGIAVLCAASQSQDLIDSEDLHKPFGITFKETDRLGMIGYIKPVAKRLKSCVKDMYIFDKGISETGFFEKGSSIEILPMERQEVLLPTCDIVMISGTTMINGTIDHLLDICTNVREIVMLGSSTPMFPDAFLDTKVTVLAGSWWKIANKIEIFKSISMAGGISELGDYAIKKSVKVI
ncbi:hypothetical protein GC105_07500 [Alkalibaculum sp. M08DMB]|uniref:DUF364 domain-containing protein n=1 Tax=Alkalibaculum sporogenes TaxID=2655001 RepID=A0A6A7K8C7_9FIRM|nr:DUF364 domain-containing protein [Alkalibaculum sporogenes]MPW25632.1 hypothetical protein [Alkalibaculum sporogenes]